MLQYGSGLRRAELVELRVKDVDLERVTSHALRHNFATHLLEAKTDLRMSQNSLDHADVRVPELYTHVAKGSNGLEVTRSLDELVEAVGGSEVGD